MRSFEIARTQQKNRAIGLGFSNQVCLVAGQTRITRRHHLHGRDHLPRDGRHHDLFWLSRTLPW